MGEFSSLIANVGFPIAVSIYLLIRVENKISNLTIAINQLTFTISTEKNVSRETL